MRIVNMLCTGPDYTCNKLLNFSLESKASGMS
jgi:hypothetical protein